MSNNSEYQQITGKCLNCKKESNLLQQTEDCFASYGAFDLYAIRVCTSCGFWTNSVLDGFFTKEEIKEL